MAVRLEMVVVVRSNRLPSIARDAPRVADRAIDWAAREIKDEADRSFRGPKSGRIYRYYTGGGAVIIHQASAAGESPAVLSERLARSARVESIPGGKAVTWNVHYADDLEFGRGRLAPRPFARPAAIRVFPKMALRIKSDLENL